MAAVLFAGCEGPPPIQPVTLRSGTFLSIDYLPYYVMQDQGFDRKYGLRFKETVFAGGAAALVAIAGDAIDMSPAVGIAPVLAAAERGLIPEKAVAVAVNDYADREHRAVGVVAAHGVQGWKDLDGRKLGINARNGIPAAALEARLRQERVRDYSYVEILLPNLGLALAGGNVAAVAMAEPYLTQSLLRGDGKLLDWVVGGAPFERAVYASIVFSAEFRRANPEGVKAYLRAHLAAVRWIDDHPDAARRLLAARLNLNEAVASKVNLPRWPADGRSDPAQIDETQRVLHNAGILKSPVDSRRLHDETLLSEVLEEAR
jgi:NitT/TauT family transport system substrate-binding protein